MNEPAEIPQAGPAQPGVPQDRPLSGVVGRLDEYGLDAQFRPLPGARLRCVRGGHDFDAARLSADHVGRIEGASDPDDMVMVVPVACPICGARGQLVLHYGPMSSAEDSDVMAALQRHPGDSSPCPDPPNLA